MSLFELIETKLRFSIPYYPQSDGQTEVCNKTLQQYLRASVPERPSLWCTFLHWIEWHYSISIHNATGFSTL